jgi:chemotaxis protein MotA
MDTLSVAGILIALAAIIGGNLLEGGHTDSLVQLTAFVIVVGGTLGAIMVQVPLPTFLRSLQLGRWVFKPPRFEPSATIRKIVQWSNIARKEGLLGLENIAEREKDLFARKGLQLVVDGNEPETIRSIMEVDLDSHEYRDMQAARVFEGMGGYAPTVGIIGAVLGLIHVMNNLADPELLGEGIAVAFVATIYGVGLANLFLLPAASKLKSYIHRQAQFREMVIEGLVSIAEGENPRNIETKLQGYLLTV